MTILEAIADTKLFARWFKRGLLRGDSFAAWRAFLAGLFGLSLDDIAFETFKRHTGRSVAPTEQSREAFAICGRRGGKSLIAALIATFLAAFKDYSAILAPGETGVVMVLASDRRQARVLLGYVNGFFDRIPMLARMIDGRTKESITLNNRIQIEVHTASFRAVRGYTVVAAILDEVAFWPSDESAHPDTETLNALRPAMATVPGALLLGISSPYARRGALWEVYREHYGKNGAPVFVWKAATREMNPTVSPRVIEDAYARDAAAAAAEFGAEFRTDVEAFIPREAVDAAVVAGRLELPFISGTRYFGFVDPSGGASDSMTLGIAHVAESGKAVLDVLREVKPPFSPEAVTRDFGVLLKAYRISVVSGDRYGAEWVVQQFAKNGCTYQTAEQSKSEIYLELLPAISSRVVELLDNARLVTQLCGLERRTARGGRDSVDHAPGGHDDVINAGAGALVAAMRSGQRNGLFEWYRQQAEALNRPANPTPPSPDEQFKTQADAGMVAAKSSDLKVAHVFGQQIGPAPRIGNEKAPRPAATRCPKCASPLSVSGVAGLSGDRLERCGACGFERIVAAVRK